jgi:hypothetical protein
MLLRQMRGHPARIVSQAACVAIPFRSDPDDAAVAEVLGTLPVSVAVIFTASVSTPNSRRHLRHLLEQALSHLGAAMVQMDRPILIDMHQGPGLIQVVSVKEIPNFTGVSASPRFNTGLAAFHAATAGAPA